MWKKIVLVILTLSLALNVAFTATWAVRTITAGPHDGARPPESAQEGEIWSPLHRKLDVTEEQWKQIEPLMRQFMETMKVRRERISEVRHKMLDLLFSPNVDRKAIEEQQDRVLNAFRKTQDVVLQHVLTERKYLTAEQERKLKRMLERRMSTSGPGNPPIGPRNERGGGGVGKAFRQMEDTPPQQDERSE